MLQCSKAAAKCGLQTVKVACSSVYSCAGCNVAMCPCCLSKGRGPAFVDPSERLWAVHHQGMYKHPFQGSGYMLYTRKTHSGWQLYEIVYKTPDDKTNPPFIHPGMTPIISSSRDDCYIFIHPEITPISSFIQG